MAVSLSGTWQSERPQLNRNIIFRMARLATDFPDPEAKSFWGGLQFHLFSLPNKREHGTRNGFSGVTRLPQFHFKGVGTPTHAARTGVAWAFGCSSSVSSCCSGHRGQKTCSRRVACGCFAPQKVHSPLTIGSQVKCWCPRLDFRGKFPAGVLSQAWDPMCSRMPAHRAEVQLGNKFSKYVCRKGSSSSTIENTQQVIQKHGQHFSSACKAPKR